ncbi:MAG: phosphopantothenoylcysteine decarboxylase [Nitrospirae bacterium RIFCSPLOW2_12_42_9]|nr:MAG: phosphopantothenoylcysteine decarboxylase [Nitrospirae bacterium RIFCSPLOW2_12_42_9]
MTLAGKKIILGVTGSIAAYKAVFLLRRLIEEGADVTVVMTRYATNFVAPLTFQVLSKKPVYSGMFDPDQGKDIIHLYLNRGADVILVAPATANIIGKMANGIADDLLSTMLIAARCPVILAPAMDYEMYENPVVQKNISYLRNLKIDFVGPETGLLASGDTGPGRMSEPDDIITFLEDKLGIKGDLSGHTVLITAGPTREAIDPVRYISSRSSGKMGYAIAEAAKSRGAKVILITGPASLTIPQGIEAINVITAEEMLDAVMNRLSDSTVLIMTAAVSDFRPAEKAISKIKKGEAINLKLIKTPDILEEVCKKKGNQFVVGFAAETEDLITNAKEKLRIKHLDMIVANNVSLPGAGFEKDTNIVTLIDKEGKIKEYPEMPKSDVADMILDNVISKINKGYNG